MTGRTLIVDDEEDMRLLLSMVINTENRGLEVVAQAESGHASLTIHEEVEIDVVVMDQRMPGLSGIETARQLLAAEPDLPIVIYSAFIDAALRKEAREIGVRYCVEKGDRRSLIAALRDVTGLEILDPSS
ncbi:MAG: response regulator transcription factor [Microthrixaceae bacterium]